MQIRIMIDYLDRMQAAITPCFKAIHLDTLSITTTKFSHDARKIADV